MNTNVESDTPKVETTLPPAEGEPTPPSNDSTGEKSEGNGDQVQHWSGNYGDLADSLKSYASKEAFLSRMKDAEGYFPAKSTEEIQLSIPEGVEVDEAAQKEFKQFCVDNGLTPKMAQALSEWQIRQVTQNLQKKYEDGQKILRDKWGAKFENNTNQALHVFGLLDRKMEGRLAPAFKSNGLSNDPTIIEALYTLSSLVSEDSLAGATAGSGEPKEMTTEEFLKKEVFGGK